jgi:hypothetical protein
MPPEDPDGFAIGVEHPVLLNPEDLVTFELDSFIHAAGALGKDLNNEIRGALGVFLVEDPGTPVGDEKQVRLHDIVAGEENIEGRREHLAEAVLLYEQGKPGAQPHREPLVWYRGGGAHVVLPVDDLVPLAVLREEEVVLIGKLAAGEVVEGHGASPSATISILARRALEAAGLSFQIQESIST